MNTAERLRATEPTTPFYRRAVPRFQHLLEASPTRVIPAMDLSGDDIPYQLPKVRLALPSVGLNRHHVPVRLTDPLGSGGIVQASCDVQVRTHVPSHKRGIHTSRIGDAVARTCLGSFPSLQAFAASLADTIDETQYSKGTVVDVSGIVSFVEPVRGWKSLKNKASLEHLGLHASAVVNASEHTQSAGLSFHHITACPCVQQTYKHALSQVRDDVGTAIERVAPLLTHSQRCRTRVMLDGLDTELDVAHLLEALDATLYRVQNTLPRDHELALVYRAHAAPQFIEDAVRETLRTVGDAFGDRHPDAAVRVEAVSYESIHDYDIAADVRATLAELNALPRAA